MRFTSLTQRFVVWFLVISLLPILLIGYSLLHTFEKELQQTVSRQISAIADKKSDQIDVYLHERRNEVMVNAQSDATRRAMAEFAQTFAQGGVESDAYRRLDARYRDYFKRFIISAGYYDLFLISPQGAVVYSHIHEPDFATNLFAGSYRNTGLAEAARNAMSTLESDVSEFELYGPSGNAIAAFIAVPIMIQGRIIGALALQIDNTRVFQVLLDKTGLGDSGETVVARREDEHTALAVTPLKSLPDAALKHRLSLSDPRRATPMVHALNGERGSGFGRDYLGRPVLAAWRYLPVMRLGMVVKMDAAEALAPLYRVRNFSLAVLGLAFLAAFFGALLLGRRMAAPLRSLSNRAQDIAAGKLDQRVPVVGRDELGLLAGSFNTMAERLQSFHAELEEKIAQRTAELARALAQEQETQAALRHERDFAASLVNIAPVIVLQLDTQGVIEYVNPHFEQITGYRLDEVRGKEWFRTFLPARDRDKIRALFRKAAHDAPTRGNINPIVTRSGEELEIEWYDQPMRDAQGKVFSVLATGQDVTARRFMERALRASAERLNETQRIAQLGGWELDLLTGRLAWSDEVFRLFEIDKNRFGATYEAFLDAVHPDDRDRVSQAYAHSIETRKPYEITHRLLMSDGRIKWLHERCETFFDAGGKPLRSLGMVQDITRQMQAEESLRESEERLRLALDASSQGLYDLNVQTGEAIVNAEYAHMLGYDPAEFHETNAAWIERLHPDDSDLVAAAYRDYVAGKIPEYRVEFRQRTQSGEWKWILSIGKLVEWDAQGRPLRMLGVHFDISDRKRIEAALIEAKQAAEAASQAKSKFLANMSHEIRTPMNAILGLTQLVLDTELTPRQQDFLKKAHASAQSLLGILNEILDFSKIEAGRMDIEQVPFRLKEILEHVADLFCARIEEKGLELLLEIEPDAPAEIIGDPLRLAQVLTNLVSNAVKFTERGAIRIKVEVAERDPATQRLRFTVRDTGIGLSRAQAERLFQAFTQADSSTTRKYGGTGLGLAICKQLVELMGGEISVSSAEGQGSTFVFTIQAGVVSSHDTAQPLAIKTPVAPAQSAAGEPAIDREALTQVLSRLALYLQEQELVPVELMESLHSLARSDFPDKSLARLIRQVDHFDHDGALASVVQLAAIHGVALE